MHVSPEIRSEQRSQREVTLTGGFETTGWVTTHLVYPVLKPTISFLVKYSRYRDFLIKQTIFYDI